MHHPVRASQKNRFQLDGIFIVFFNGPERIRVGQFFFFLKLRHEFVYGNSRNIVSNIYIYFLQHGVGRKTERRRIEKRCGTFSRSLSVRVLFLLLE